MKYIFFLLLLTFIVSCATSSTRSSSSSSSSNQETVDPAPVDTVDTANAIDPAEQVFRKYREEGFVNSNTYSIIIVRPSDSTDSRSDIQKQAKQRTLVSFRKHIQSQGKRVTPNANASLLVLINDNGKMIQVDDEKQSRVVYVYLVERQNLKRYVEGLD
jgi:hypothetical protein